MPDQTKSAVPVWEVRNLTKRFAGIVANDSVSLVLERGKIHGLLGENGCGKSTLIKMLMGVFRPSGGEILRDGKPVTIPGPMAARAAGVAAVFQEFSLVPTLTVAENIWLGNLPGRRTRVDWQAMRDSATEVMSRLSVSIDPEAIVADLSVADQQLVEIAKAIATDASMLILDEPTTALGLEEIHELHRVLRGLAAQNKAVLYISHRLDEVEELVDCVTVLKDGRVVSTAAETEVSVEAFVAAMIGEVSNHYPKTVNTREDVLLEAHGLRTANRVRDVSFTVRAGEVFGLGGVLGSGRTEIARALFGVDPLLAGTISVAGEALRLRSPADAVAAGIALVPENRKSDGLFFNFQGQQNMSVAALSRLGSPLAMRLREETRLTHDLYDRLEVSASAKDRLVGLLSGGNQQKIVIGRWLFAGARVFLLDEPTQGIDVGARTAVYNLINELTAAGHAVVLISSDDNELLAMSDRIGIVSHGRLVDIRAAADVKKSDLVRASSSQEAAA
ncbi:sugar ABC transporter ATP-binding protein [Tropicimonas marinistellae]|uniref:sugar ABC transporter ATP-binding protein n=1 Tax=Tropicimonas marinistellae TaxID=1739787 RepID=UPI00082B17CA|nr:sugar ABC transporter ATP-binding protein [Tropicimonas marinistellae]